MPSFRKINVLWPILAIILFVSRAAGDALPPLSETPAVPAAEQTPPAARPAVPTVTSFTATGAPVLLPAETTENYEVSSSTVGPARRIAMAYGLDRTYEIEALNFTFNLRDGAKQIRREWSWDIADDRVEYRGNGPAGIPIAHIYRRDQMNSGDAELNRQIDAWFVEDQYWLLFPYHLAWEKTLAFDHDPAKRMRIEPREAESLMVRYPQSGPNSGDTYELFFGPDAMIREWAYYPKGADEPAFVTTWERPVKAGPFVFSTLHRAKDKGPAVWFDNIAVKIADKGWAHAVPLERAVSRRPDESGSAQRGL